MASQIRQIRLDRPRWAIVVAIVGLIGLAPVSAGADNSRLYISPDRHWSGHYNGHYNGPYSRQHWRGYQKGYRQGYRERGRYRDSRSRFHHRPHFSWFDRGFRDHCGWVRVLRHDRFGNRVHAVRRVCR